MTKPSELQSSLYGFSSLNLSMLMDSINMNDTGVDIDLIDGCELMNEITVTSKLNMVISILGTIICFIGVIGNIFSIIVLCKKSMKKLSTYSYLLGLSISDEMSLILTVFIWLEHLLPYMCMHLSCQNRVKVTNFHKISLYFIYPIVSSFQALSVWITLAFTIDRYLYVCKPFVGVKYCTRQRASLIICLLYILASVYSIPQFLERKYVKEEIYGIERYFIGYTELGRNFFFNSIYHLFIYCVFVTLIPFFVIMLLNVFLVYEIVKSRKRLRKMSFASSHFASNGTKLRGLSCFRKKDSKTESDSVELDNLNKTKNSVCSQVNFASKSVRNDVTLMLVGLIVVFFICQVPSTILRLITFKNLSIFFKPLYQSTLDISNFLVVCNSTVNCILYVMLGKKFRDEFIKTFFPNFCQDANDQNKSKNYNFNGHSGNGKMNSEA